MSNLNVSSAASLFSDIHAHSLSELLTSVLHDISPLGSTLIPTLDEYLDHTRPEAACKRGDVIKVQGPANSGKSHLLYYLLVNCVLPASHLSVQLSGWEKAAVLLDTDHKFNVERFNQLLRSRVRRFLPLNPSAVEAISIKALDLLHVFRPTSSHQLAATIQHLPIYLATKVPKADLGLLAVDSMTAFYWPDRYILEQTRFSNANRTLTRSHNPYNHVLTALHSLAQSHGPLILLSSWDLGSTSITQDQWRLDASVTALRSDNTDKLGQHLLPVSHYITVISSHLNSDDGDIASDSGTRTPSTIATTCLSGNARSSGSTNATKFKLHITEDDIVVP